MCYRFRIISEIRSNNEFSSRKTKIPAIRMNTNMLNLYYLYYLYYFLVKEITK